MQAGVEVQPTGAMIDGISLTRKERELLEVFLNHLNLILDRRYLLKNIWGYDERARTRTVEVHIVRLRRKLDSHTDLRIQTVYGKGYVMTRRPEYLEPAPHFLTSHPSSR